MKQASLIALLLITSSAVLYAQGVDRSLQTDKAVLFLAGSWNPINIGPDNPEKEEYNWFVSTVNGEQYRCTNLDIGFEIINGTVSISGNGGRLEVLGLKKEDNVWTFSVRSIEYKKAGKLGSVFVIVLNQDQVVIIIQMPSDWGNAFGGDEIVYRRAVKAK